MDESTLWEAADRMRPYIDAAEYKEVVLDLHCLKSLSAKKWIPHKASWEYIKSQCEGNNENIATLVQDAFELIQTKNPSYSGLFTVDYNNLGIPNSTFIEIINLFESDEKALENDRDNFGELFEYFLRNFALAEGKRAGQFYTPRSVVELLVRLIKPTEGTLYDPCCGTGGMFVHAEKMIRAKNKDKPSNMKYIGQESNPKTWRLAKKNLLAQELEHNLGGREQDTLLTPIHATQTADYCLANPPFNMSKWGALKMPKAEADLMFCGLPPDGNANLTWVQHIISRLKENGKGAIILANGSLDVSDGGQKEIRKKVIESGVLEAIISLPGELFYSTTIPVCVWIISKQKSVKREGVLFVDASSCEGTFLKRGLRELSPTDLDKITDVYDYWSIAQCTKNIHPVRSNFVNNSTLKEGPIDLNPGRHTIKESVEILQGTEWNFSEQDRKLRDSIRVTSQRLSALKKVLSNEGLEETKRTAMTKLSSVASSYRQSLDPSRHGDEIFDLYSIPAFDDTGVAEQTKGSDIGSNKLIIRKPSILVSRLNPRTPRIWVARPGSKRAICSTEFTVLEIEDETLFSTVFIALHSQVATSHLKSFARGTTGSRKRVRDSDLMNIEIPLAPSLESPIATGANMLVALKEDLNEAVNLIDKIIPQVADESYRKLND